MLINNKSLINTINKLNLTDDEREKFNKISEDDKGNFLYNGKSVIPYPFNGDQLHCSSLGYARIGECIVGSIIRVYGY